MGLVSKVIGNQNLTADQNTLTADELEFILSAMRQIMIKGEQVELFYNMILKLQNQYTIQQQAQK